MSSSRSSNFYEIQQQYMTEIKDLNDGMAAMKEQTDKEIQLQKEEKEEAMQKIEELNDQLIKAKKHHKHT